MASTKSTEPPTRIHRRIAPYRGRGREIVPVGRGAYTVLGCSSGSFTVNLARLAGRSPATSGTGRPYINT